MSFKIDTEEQENCLEFYKKAQDYWSKIPPTVNGMLGGLGYISATDIQGSNIFLRNLKQLKHGCALDCGAGIGRVSKNLLLPSFATVDQVEQDSNFSKRALEYCQTFESSSHRIGTIFNEGLQQFSPEIGKYDLIWCQWVLGHLTDNDLLSLFTRLKVGLKDQGFLIIKENVTSSQNLEVDNTDSSVTRSLKMYEDLIKLAGYRIVKTMRQLNFPNDLYPVYMIACRPHVSI